jgi:cytochrome c-type biogenesis protein CcmH
MMLWFGFALILAATLTALLAPLWRTSRPAPARADYDLAVYRAQLAELDADLGRGLIAPAEVEAARLEIQRRMLAAAPGPAHSDDRATRLAAAATLAMALPLGAGLLYAAQGNPQLPDKPYAERLAHEPAVILADAAAKLSAAVAAKPSEAGYRRLGELYLLQQDFENATAALKRAILLGGGDADLWAQLGEAHVLAAGGAVTAPALAAFARALEADPQAPRARFYAGLAEAQIGNFKAAAAIWRDLEKASKEDAPWLPLLRRELAAAGKKGGFDPASVPPAPPSAVKLEAAVAAMTGAMKAAP